MGQGCGLWPISCIISQIGHSKFVSKIIEINTPHSHQHIQQLNGPGWAKLLVGPNNFTRYYKDCIKIIFKSTKIFQVRHVNESWYAEPCLQLILQVCFVSSIWSMSYFFHYYTNNMEQAIHTDYFFKTANLTVPIATTDEKAFNMMNFIFILHIQ